MAQEDVELSEKGLKRVNMILNWLQVRKVEEEGELPGLMIEEMMESASVVRVDRCGDDREEIMDVEMLEEMGIDKNA